MDPSMLENFKALYGRAYADAHDPKTIEEGFENGREFFKENVKAFCLMFRNAGHPMIHFEFFHHIFSFDHRTLDEFSVKPQHGWYPVELWNLETNQPVPFETEFVVQR